MTDQIVLKTEKLTKHFGSFTAVKNLDLTVQAGDIYGFLGLNGAGKTTTIRMILKLIKPSNGQIWINGQELDRHYLELMKNIGALVEIPAFYSYLSGWDNLVLLSRMSYGRADKKKLEKLLADVGLLDRARDKVRAYSQGMRQRLGIAQALLPTTREDGEPKIIILDEPTNGLDPQGITDIRNLIKQLHQTYQLTFLISSHLLYEIELLCNRVGVIKQGTLAVQGTVSELVKGQADRIKLRARPVEPVTKLLAGLDWCREVSAKPADEEWLIKAPAEKIPELNNLLVKNKIEVLEIAPKQKSLEEYFLEII
ncbi:MAG: ABC transporter ATP-binding protein [Planctomycetes bacterium]|nr:ABC transporter ATP-binding protein [Planctomycetota bacterium]